MTPTHLALVHDLRGPVLDITLANLCPYRRFVIALRGCLHGLHAPLRFRLDCSLSLTLKLSLLSLA